jgi:putative transposase
MGRGIERGKIFLNNKDRNDFITRLATLAEEDSMDIYAWALIPNHFHLLCKTKKRPLSSSMRRLLTGYVVNFNRRHKRHGHLFQNRYKSIICQEDAYLVQLVRYIHLNLVRVGVVRDIEELNRSPWSGHSALVGYVRREWQDTPYVLSFFGGRRNGKRRYLKFVEEGAELGRMPELVGGGLIRSLGGWAEVLALRARGDRQVSDQRVLGDAEFVERVLSEMDEVSKENLRVRARRGRDLSSLAKRVCKVNGVSVGELRSGSRRREIVDARQILSSLAVKEL